MTSVIGKVLMTMGAIGLICCIAGSKMSTPLKWVNSMNVVAQAFGWYVWGRADERDK